MTTTRTGRLFAATYTCAYLTVALLRTGDLGMALPLWVAYLTARDHL